MTCSKCQGLMVEDFGEYRCVNCGRIVGASPVQRRPRKRVPGVRHTPADQAGEAGSIPAGRSTRSRWRPPKFEKACADCHAPFIGLAAAKYCPICRARRRLNPRWALSKKYDWTPERLDILKREYDGKVRRRAAAIARKFGWPDWVIKKKAAELGLCYAIDRKEWTKDEERYLLNYAGRRTVQWMVKRLPGRTMTTVTLKLKRMGISRRFREGYTLRDLETCFGIDHHSLDRWIAEGKLTGRRRGTARKGSGGRPLGVGSGPADPWVFTDKDVVTFITQHPTAFRLDKVDQVWFMELLLGGRNVLDALDVKWALESACARFTTLRYLGLGRGRREPMFEQEDGRSLTWPVGETLQTALDRSSSEPRMTA